MVALEISEELKEVLDSLKEDNQTYEDILWGLVNQFSDSE